MTNAARTLLDPWTGPQGGVPPFDRVVVAAFVPALEEGMTQQLAELDAIANAKEAPTFESTLVAIERAGQALARASRVFGVWSGNLSSPEVRAVETEMAPKLAAFGDRIVQNTKLFQRVKAVYDARETSGLSPEQQRLAWVTHQYFVREGANLDDANKAELSKVNQALAALYTRFSQNQLADEEGLSLTLPDGQVLANTRSAMEPFLTYSPDRAMREKAFRMWTGRGDGGGEHDNNAIVQDILKLRAKKAKLLGYETYAHWFLSDAMAKEPSRAMDLMVSVWNRAVVQFKKDVAAAQKIADEEGGKLRIEPWDYRYYAEKLRKKQYDLDMNQLTPYLQLERIREAMFWAADALYGLKFTLVDGIPVFHPDVRVYAVSDDKGAHRGYWYFDPYARPGKQSGAWMSAYREQHRLDGGQTTIVSNNSNFNRADGPVTISWDDARTMFHEFGHALHGLNSAVTYPSLSGTNTTRDFVEFPSQFMENYLSTPEVLAFLVDEKGQRIPKDLLERVERAQAFNQGFASVEMLASAIVDMKLHLAGDRPIDTKAFEKETLEELGMPREVVMRHRIPAFGHIFSGEGYAAGYYSYLWAEVLERDAFDAFNEASGPYDKTVAKRLHDTVMSVGNTVDPAEAFARFRGRAPSPDALLRHKGF